MPVSYTHLDVYKRQVICTLIYSLKTQVSLLPPPWEEFTTKEPSLSATPVSYTHLDVYKRQILDWMLNSEWGLRILKIPNWLK